MNLAVLLGLFSLPNIVNPRHTCAVRVMVVVSVSVCVSLKTSGASSSPDNTVTYSAGNGGQNLWGFL